MSDDRPEEPLLASLASNDAEANPYRSPEAAGPLIDTSGDSSPLVKKLRRKSGNDLIWCAVAASVFGYFIPFGVVLDGLSLFLIIRSFVSRSRPDTIGIVFGVIVGLWNLIRLGVVVLLVAVFLLSGA
jgi:hypothetical protein